MTLKNTFQLLLILAFLPAAAAEAANVAGLVEKDFARAQIFIAAPEDDREVLAARELAGHLALAGAPAPEIFPTDPAAAAGRVAAARAAGHLPVLVGTLALGELRASLEKKRAGGDAFSLRVEENRVLVAGLSAEGTLNGVYELLEQLGFRWFMPGRLGLTLPEPGEMTLAAQATVQVPSFRGRLLRGACPEWMRRNRLGGEAAPSRLAMPAPGDFETDPQLFALVDGERNRRQLCLDNTATLAGVTRQARAYFRRHPERQWMAMGSWGGAHCECRACRETDPPVHCGPFSGGINISDRYVRFANLVLEALEDEFPDRRLSLTMGTPHLCPPVGVHGHRRLDIVAWPVAHCRIHGVNNPACPEQAMLLRRTGRWREQLRGGYYIRTGWSNRVCPGFLFPMVHRFREDMPAYHRLGVGGFRIFTYGYWASENPSAYIGAKLLWDHDADVEALLADFYRRFYGPAAGPMKAWHELIDAAVGDADHHTGTALDMPHIYPPGVRARGRRLLRQAARAAAGVRRRDERYADRVAAVILALDYLESFLDMIERRNHHDYAGAQAALERALGIIERFEGEHDPPLMNGALARNYLERYFGGITREGHERTGPGGELAAGLGERWEFLLDPEGIGEDLGWWKPESTGGNWQSIAGGSSSWSNQGLRYYRGDAWYRQSVRIPARFSGRRLVLWVGAIDERARVWVNGRLLGDSPIGAFSPFEFDATEAARPGRENVVVIKAGNHITQEVGTGGLLAPVMFHAPREK